MSGKIKYRIVWLALILALLSFFAFGLSSKLYRSQEQRKRAEAAVSLLDGSSDQLIRKLADYEKKQQPVAFDLIFQDGSYQGERDYTLRSAENHIYYIRLRPLSFFPLTSYIVVPILAVALLSLLVVHFSSQKMHEEALEPMRLMLRYLNGVMNGTISSEDEPTEVDQALTEFMGSSEEKEELMIHLRQLSESTNLRRQFTANVSHELKSPLTSIIGYAELIENGVVPEEDARNFAGIIRREGERLLLMINQTIELSKFDSGYNDYDERSRFVFNQLIEDEIETIRPTAEKNHVDIYFSGELVEVYGNPRLLGDMIQNLLSNAVKYSKPEGGHVYVNLSSEGDQLVLSVRDDGIGISEEDQKNVFKRFYRVDQARTNRGSSGTGLGLSLVKHTVQVHGGRIILHSRLGVGSEFLIYLPAYTDSQLEKSGQ